MRSLFFDLARTAVSQWKADPLENIDNTLRLYSLEQNLLLQSVIHHPFTHHIISRSTQANAPFTYYPTTFELQNFTIHPQFSPNQSYSNANLSR